jgi:hypothetical protein
MNSYVQAESTPWSDAERTAYLKGLGVFTVPGEEALQNVLEVALADAPLVRPWQLKRDGKNRAFFVNTANGQTSWKHPIEPSLRELAEVCRHFLQFPKEQRSQPVIEVQHAWEQEVAKELGKWFVAQDAKGREYYYHQETEETTWEHPSVALLPTLYVKTRALERVCQFDSPSVMTAPEKNRYSPQGNAAQYWPTEQRPEEQAVEYAAADHFQQPLQPQQVQTPQAALLSERKASGEGEPVPLMAQIGRSPTSLLRPDQAAQSGDFDQGRRMDQAHSAPPSDSPVATANSPLHVKGREVYASERGTASVANPSQQAPMPSSPTPTHSVSGFQPPPPSIPPLPWSGLRRWEHADTQEMQNILRAVTQSAKGLQGASVFSLTGSSQGSSPTGASLLAGRQKVSQPRVF